VIFGKVKGYCFECDGKEKALDIIQIVLVSICASWIVGSQYVLRLGMAVLLTAVVKHLIMFALPDKKKKLKNKKEDCGCKQKL
jgi:hypothetical protein